MSYVTIRDIAREAGVSAAAVSQILHNKGRFSDETRELVLRTVRDMGYVPDQRARAMRSSEGKTIGLLVPDLRNPYFADLVSSMEDELFSRGYSTLIGTSGESVDRQDAFIYNLLGQRINGAIVVPQGVDSPGIRSLIGRDLPLVFVDRRIENIDMVPFVVSDPYPGVKETVAELVRLGHKRIGYVGHSVLGSVNINERAIAFSTAITQMSENKDHAVTSCMVDCDSTHESHEQALDELLEFGVTALLGAYSPDMVMMIGLLQDRGISVGDDMSLVSFDDINVFQLMTPQIAVISQQTKSMGHQGVSLLLSLIEGKVGQAMTQYVPTALLPRASIIRVKNNR